MVERKKLTLLASKGTALAWRAAALDLGYVSPSGKYMGQGSISALLDAIASGEVDGAELMQAMSVSVSVVQDNISMASDPV